MKILFQGDSITDAGRDRTLLQYMGNGYVSEIAMRFERGGLNHKIENTAISSNRICDIYARWIEDTLNHNFDVLSILCGINDVGFQIREGKGVHTEKYKFIYDRMLYEVVKKNPNAAIVILEPYVFKRNMENDNINNRNDIFLNYGLWRKEVDEKAAVSKELAEKYNGIFVPLARIFDEYTKKHDVCDLTTDGIHPTLKGHKMIADEWIKACSDILTY